MTASHTAKIAHNFSNFLKFKKNWQKKGSSNSIKYALKRTKSIKKCKNKETHKKQVMRIKMLVKLIHSEKVTKIWRHLPQALYVTK